MFDLVNELTPLMNQFSISPQENISTYQQGLEEIRDGDAWGVLGFATNYTKAVNDR